MNIDIGILYSIVERWVLVIILILHALGRRHLRTRSKIWRRTLPTVQHSYNVYGSPEARMGFLISWAGVSYFSPVGGPEIFNTIVDIKWNRDCTYLHTVVGKPKLNEYHLSRNIPFCIIQSLLLKMRYYNSYSKLLFHEFHSFASTWALVIFHKNAQRWIISMCLWY